MSVFVCTLQLRRCEWAIKYLKISIVTLLLISSALHFTEIFRLSTGSIVGLIVVYGVLRAFKIATVFFIITAMCLVVGFTRPEAGNYFFPAWTDVKSAQKVDAPKYFRGQYWPQNSAEYYANIEKDLKSIQQAHCGIDYHFNHTMDVFLQVISPFTQYQIAPFYTSDSISSLRADIGPKAQMEADKKIIIMQMVQNIHRDVFRPPDEYYVYKKYYAPNVPFIPQDQTLLIMIPLTCKQKIDQANIVK